MADSIKPTVEKGGTPSYDPAWDSLFEDMEREYGKYYDEVVEKQKKETEELQRHLEGMKDQPDDFFDPSKKSTYNGLNVGLDSPDNEKSAEKYGKLYGKERSFKSFDLNPHQKGETAREYGNRLFDGYTMNVAAQFVRRDMSGKEPETHEHHQERVKKFIAKYPRYEKETPDQYYNRLKKMFEDGEFTDDDDFEPAPPFPPTPPEDEKKSVEIGEIKLNEIDKKIEEVELKRIEDLEKELKDLLPDLAELYARNRRLIVGRENKDKFKEIQGKYGKLLDEYLELKAKHNNATHMKKAFEEIDSSAEAHINDIKAKLTEFAGGDLEHTDKTQEEIDAEKQRLIDEANAALVKEYGEKVNEVKDTVTAEFIKDLVDMQTEMEDATINALDNGSFCRKFVNKVINNKAVKTILVAAGVAGLAITGIGLLTGATALAIGFTAGGVALGAGKGALGGLLGSRQNSGKSKIRGFGNTLASSVEDIKELVKSGKINIFGGEDGTDIDTQNAAQWIIEEYDKASQEDRTTNVKKSAVAAGLGAIFGGLFSGVHFVKTVNTVQPTQQITGYGPDTYDVDLSKVDIPYNNGNYGASNTFTQLGGDPSRIDEAVNIMWQYDAKYGLVPGSNGISAGFNGQIGAYAHTYAGKISTWPQAVQNYIAEVAQAWAANGLIPANRIAGQPIYSTIYQTVLSVIPDQFRNHIARALEALIPAGFGALSGGITENARSQKFELNPEDITSEPKTEEETPETEEEPEEPEKTDEDTTEEKPDVSVVEKEREAILEYIKSKKERYGDDIGIEIIENGDVSRTDEQYREFWDNTTGFQHGYIIELLKVSRNEGLGLGNGLREWLVREDIIGEDGED